MQWNSIFYYFGSYPASFIGLKSISKLKHKASSLNLFMEEPIMKKKEDSPTSCPLHIFSGYNPYYKQLPHSNVNNLLRNKNKFSYCFSFQPFRCTFVAQHGFLNLIFRHIQRQFNFKTHFAIK